MKFIKGQLYTLNYHKMVVNRYWRGTSQPSEVENKFYSGSYEYMGNKGSKLHFFDNNTGTDVYFSKQEAIDACKGLNL